MSHMIDPKAIPAQVLVGSFLKAMAGKGVEACVVFRHGTAVATASNREGAEAMAKSVFAIENGAIEVASIALHTFRLTPEPTSEDPPGAVPAALCSIVPCAGHELDHVNAQGDAEPVKWDDLPEPIREAHRLVAKAVIAAAVAHKVPEESKLVKPT